MQANTEDRRWISGGPGLVESAKVKVESGKLRNRDVGGMGGLIWALVAMIGPSGLISDY